jgi:hypothetical protein
MSTTPDILTPRDSTTMGVFADAAGYLSAVEVHDRLPQHDASWSGGTSKAQGDSLKLSRADDVRVTCPLFQAEYGGATPTSALHLRFSRCDIKRAIALNEGWHSRLPALTNWQGCFAFSAECGNVVYAVAIWGRPVARAYNGTKTIELRRMAVADDGPKNTASRMIGWMIRNLKRAGEYTKAISYQDTAVHAGTIYKASGWIPVKVGKDTWDRPNQGARRRRSDSQEVGEKVRWEHLLQPQASASEECVSELPKGESVAPEGRKDNA